jgi:hypothetical protein
MDLAGGKPSPASHGTPRSTRESETLISGMPTNFNSHQRATKDTISR